MKSNYPKILFSVYIYARLSKEEKEKLKENEKSESIKNQIEICREWITEENKDNPLFIYEIGGIFYDDGISGTTFDRKYFNQMIESLEKGKANMIITKDLSRFGREHINADYFIEQWFPEHQIRFVAINDSVDTWEDQSSNDIIPFKNLMNEFYAKITSRNVKKTFAIKRKNGLRTGGKPVYGFSCDPLCKGKIVPDLEAQNVLQMVSMWILDGMSLNKATERLNEMEIPNPSLHKGIRLVKETKTSHLWSPSVLKSVLLNYSQIGVLAQGKERKVSYKSKKVKKVKEEEWVIIKNHHSPCFDDSTYHALLSTLKVNKNIQKQSSSYLLKGILRCHNCGHSCSLNQYSNRKIQYVVCNYYKKYSKYKVCTPHRVSYQKVEQEVLKAIQNYLSHIDVNLLEEKIRRALIYKKKENSFEKKLNSINTEKKEIYRKQKVLYSDRLSNIISLEEYQIIEKELKIKINRLQELENSLQKTCQNKVKKVYLDINKIMGNFACMRMLITNIIDRIEIDEKEKIYIHYKFVSPKI